MVFEKQRQKTDEYQLKFNEAHIQKEKFQQLVNTANQLVRKISNDKKSLADENKYLKKVLQQFKVGDFDISHL